MDHTGNERNKRECVGWILSFRNFIVPIIGMCRYM